MLKTYIKLAFRSLKNRKRTTAINIFGLSFGIACASLAFVFIQHERSFDQFHDESENIHWFYVSIDEMINLSSTPGPLVKELQESFPEVTEGTRLSDQSILVKSGTEMFKEKAVFVDPNFLNFFNFPLISGNKKTALDDINSVVISETMAKKYFGRKDPIGESLPIFHNDAETVFKISAVVKNPPSNSSIQFQFLLPLQFSHKDEIAKLESSWESFPVGSFIRLRDKGDAATFSEKLPDFIATKFVNDGDEDKAKYKFTMNAFDDYHLNNSMSISGLTSPGEPKYVNILAIIAILILIVACLNFMNLSNAQSSQRLKEVGVRQVLGAQRGQLMTQFLSESVLISFISLAIAIVLIQISIPLTSSLFDYPLEINWTQANVFLPLLGIALFTGLLAGSYPSILLSKLDTINTFKPNLKIGGNNWMTKTSLVFQFTLSIGLLVCTFTMNQQQDYINQYNLGFEEEEVIVIPTQVNYGDKYDTGRLVKQFRNELNNNQGVRDLAGVSSSFTRGNNVQFITKEDGSQDLIFEYRVDPHFIPLLNIELKEGRNFSNDKPEDAKRSVIINEAFYKQHEVGKIEDFQFPEYFGKGFTDKKIIGIAKNYHFNNLKTSIKPMYLTMDPESHFGHILVKINPDYKIQKTLARLKSTWQNLRQDKPFEFYFLDEDLQQQYVSENRWSKVLTGASILAILIAILGLFGLVSLVLAQRTKEISIRKILGARLNNIIALLSKDFLILVGISLIIASPVAWYFMDQWLNNFVHNVGVQWWVFLAAGLLVVGIALVVIGFQSIKTSLVNPVNSLKSE